MTTVGVLGYSDGIDYQIEGACSQDEVRQDFLYYLCGYTKTNTLNQSSLICEKNTGKLVAICTSGRHPNESNERFSFVSDICVLPEYRGNGLAEYMLKRALTKAVKTSEVLSLCVTVGNNTESLYHKLGFWGGNIFNDVVEMTSTNKHMFYDYINFLYS